MFGKIPVHSATSFCLFVQRAGAQLGFLLVVIKILTDRRRTEEKDEQIVL
jgi:hypothetical protein